MLLRYAVLAVGLMSVAGPAAAACKAADMRALIAAGKSDAEIDAICNPAADIEWVGGVWLAKVSGLRGAGGHLLSDRLSLWRVRVNGDRIALETAATNYVNTLADTPRPRWARANITKQDLKDNVLTVFVSRSVLGLPERVVYTLVLDKDGAFGTDEIKGKISLLSKDLLGGVQESNGTLELSRKTDIE